MRVAILFFGMIGTALAADAAQSIALHQALLVQGCPVVGVAIIDNGLRRVDYDASIILTARQKFDCDHFAQNFALPDPARFVSTVDLLGRFTDDEYAAIVAAANRNGKLAKWLDMARAAGQLNLNDPVVRQAAAALIAAGLLTPERAGAIFQ